MKTKLTLMMLFIIFSISTNNAYGMEMDRGAMHIDDSEQVIKTDEMNQDLFDDALEREVIFYKTLQPEVYKVQQGDNLFRIAINNQVELEDLMEWNDLEDYTIQPGSELLLYDDGSKKEKVVASAANTSVSSQSKKTVEKNVNQGQASKSDSTKSTQNVSASQEPAAGKEITVTATAYTAYCEGCSGTTAIGINLRSNPEQKVIAVDPNVIPLGARVWVEGYGEAIAGDTGGAIKGNKIDVFIPTQDQALKWGRKQVKVKILN